MKAEPFELAYKRKTPTWLFSRRPAVPLYCRATPADFLPYFPNPVSSTTRIPSASPPQVLHYIGAQVIAHCLFIPVRLGQQPLHPVCALLSQFLGQLPAILAFYRGQQPAQVASYAPAYFYTPKVWRDPKRQVSQGLRSLADEAQCSFPWAGCSFRLFFWAHSCSPPPILPSFDHKWHCSKAVRKAQRRHPALLSLSELL